MKFGSIVISFMLAEAFLLAYGMRGRKFVNINVVDVNNILVNINGNSSATNVTRFNGNSSFAPALQQGNSPVAPAMQQGNSPVAPAMQQGSWVATPSALLLVSTATTATPQSTTTTFTPPSTATTSTPSSTATTSTPPSTATTSSLQTTTTTPIPLFSTNSTAPFVWARSSVDPTILRDGVEKAWGIISNFSDVINANTTEIRINFFEDGIIEAIIDTWSVTGIRTDWKGTIQNTDNVESRTGNIHFYKYDTSENYYFTGEFNVTERNGTETLLCYKVDTDLSTLEKRKPGQCETKGSTIGTLSTATTPAPLSTNETSGPLLNTNSTAPFVWTRFVYTAEMEPPEWGAYSEDEWGIINNASTVIKAATEKVRINFFEDGIIEAEKVSWSDNGHRTDWKGTIQDTDNVESGTGNINFYKYTTSENYYFTGEFNVTDRNGTKMLHCYLVETQLGTLEKRKPGQCEQTRSHFLQTESTAPFIWTRGSTDPTTFQSGTVKAWGLNNNAINVINSNTETIRITFFEDGIIEAKKTSWSDGFQTKWIGAVQNTERVRPGTGTIKFYKFTSSTNYFLNAEFNVIERDGTETLWCYLVDNTTVLERRIPTQCSLVVTSG